MWGVGEGRGARQHAHAWVGRQRGELAASQAAAGRGLDRSAGRFVQQRAAGLGLFVADNDARTGFSGRLAAAARPAGPAPTTSTSQWANRLA